MHASGKTITSHTHSCPKLSCDFVALSHKRSLFSLSKNGGAENSVSSERHVSVNDVLLCGGCCPLHSVSDQRPPSSGPRPSPSLHITQWPETTGPKQPHHLFHLLNESNFLPESTKRAHTSIETLNDLTLIQINNNHCYQDCATPQ